jgi:hypothetical protein
MVRPFAWNNKKRPNVAFLRGGILHKVTNLQRDVVKDVRTFLLERSPESLEIIAEIRQLVERMGSTDCKIA